MYRSLNAWVAIESSQAKTDFFRPRVIVLQDRRTVIDRKNIADSTEKIPTHRVILLPRQNEMRPPESPGAAGECRARGLTALTAVAVAH
jgi:hypothetical protein